MTIAMGAFAKRGDWVIRHRVRPIVGKSLETRYLPPPSGEGDSAFRGFQSVPIAGGRKFAPFGECTHCIWVGWMHLNPCVSKTENR